MMVGDPSRVDGWMAGTPPPVILRHDRGLRRGEAAGFNTRRKASGAVMQACLPARYGGVAARNKCLSQAAQEVKPEASSLSNPWSSLRSGVTRG